MLKEKCKSVLELGEKLNIQNGDVSVHDGILNIKGTAKSLYEKNLLWDAIKLISGNTPSDIKADIRIADESVFHRHTVKKGETLGEIAKLYYGNPMNYKQIFQANSNILKNPDSICPD